jgi:hypothetical protein
MSHDDHSLTLLEGVLETLRRGESLDQETLQHLGSCVECSDALGRLRSLDQLLSKEPVEPESRPGLAAAVIRAVRSRKSARAFRFFVASIALLVLSLAVIAWAVYSTNSVVAERNAGLTLGYLFLLSLAPGYASSMLRARLVPSRETVALFLLAYSLTPLSIRLTSTAVAEGVRTLPWMAAIVAFSGVVCGFIAGGGGLPFKRLRRGRQLSGVALGIAEELGLSVRWVRFALIGLILVAAVARDSPLCAPRRIDARSSGGPPESVAIQASEASTDRR